MNKSSLKISSLSECLKEARKDLKKFEIQTPALDARVLLSFVTEKPIEWIFAHGEESLSAEQREQFEALIKRRIVGEPVARLTNQKEFWGMSFQLVPETLVPRPDSETLIESVLDLLPDREGRYQFLDLGTGSGCLLAALLTEYQQAEGVGVDLSPEAVEQAKRNWESLDLGGRSQATMGKWCAALDENKTFDLIISNPPYIPDDDVSHLDVEVKDHDPSLALKGGDDGLDCYRSLEQETKSFLKPEGFFVLEIGAGQAEEVTGLFTEQGWRLKTARLDLGGHIRALVFQSLVKKL